jgi:fatty-acyl-CoA synthase
MAGFAFTPLTPTAFLDRSAVVFADQEAVVDGDLRLTYREFHARSRRLATGLQRLGVGVGSRVAALCANSHVLLELHHAVPYLGAVLVPLNVRLSADEATYVVRHSGASVLIATVEHEGLAREVAGRLGVRLVLEQQGFGPAADVLAYEQLLAAAEIADGPEVDEAEPLAISYTSGTTGKPKGVVYHRRGGYLQALAMTLHTGLGSDSRYLWTLPQFHCNGWCFTWAVTAAGGTHVCLRRFDPEAAWQLVEHERVTHFSAAPTVLNMLAASGAAKADGTRPPIQVSTGGAPPSQALLERLTGLGMEVTHLYGLTETFGPVVINQWKPQWSALPIAEQAVLKARQGVGNVIADPIRVIDLAGTDVPRDGVTLGEIVCRGNNLMLGYLDDPEATAAAETADGWFRTGDLAVMHPDGYVEIKDRAKDIIISGGENISSVEVEQLLDAHPAVFEAAVVAMPHEVWGEVPVAFVQLKDGMTASVDELTQHVRSLAAHYKAPREVRFVVELPRSVTGKIEKARLRALVSGGPTAVP